MDYTLELNEENPLKSSLVKTVQTEQFKPVTQEIQELTDDFERLENQLVAYNERRASLLTAIAGNEDKFGQLPNAKQLVDLE